MCVCVCVCVCVCACGNVCVPTLETAFKSSLLSEMDSLARGFGLTFKRCFISRDTLSNTHWSCRASSLGIVPAKWNTLLSLESVKERKCTNFKEYLDINIYSILQEKDYYKTTHVL